MVCVWYGLGGYLGFWCVLLRFVLYRFCVLWLRVLYLGLFWVLFCLVFALCYVFWGLWLLIACLDFLGFLHWTCGTWYLAVVDVIWWLCVVLWLIWIDRGVVLGFVDFDLICLFVLSFDLRYVRFLVEFC